jgi:hypothetical protein
VTSDLDLHSAQALDRNRPVATDTDPYIAYVLNLWLAESESDLDRLSLWRGALALAIAGVATTVLLGAVILLIGYRSGAAIWISIGMPLLLLAAAAARFSAGRVRRAHQPHA